MSLKTTLRIGRLCGLGLLLGCLVWGARAQAREADAVLAVVDGKAITETDLMRVIAPVAQQYMTAYSGWELEDKIGKLKKETLSQMVQNELMILEANRLKIEVTDLDVDQRIKEISTRLKNADEFSAAVDREYGSQAEFRKAIKEQILVKMLLARVISPKLRVSFDEIQDYYNRNAAQYKEDAKVRIRHMLLKKTDGVSWEDLARKADEYYQQLQQPGADFEALVRAHSDGPDASDGGDMGFVAKGKILKDIEDAAFALEIGKFSKPIRTDMGYHIIRVEASKQPRVVPLYEVSAEIEDLLSREKRKKAVEDYAESLKTRYFVQILSRGNE